MWHLNLIPIVVLIKHLIVWLLKIMTLDFYSDLITHFKVKDLCFSKLILSLDFEQKSLRV